MLNYKGYTADIKVDLESKTLHGQVLGIKDVVTFEADNVKEVEEEFCKSVDAYLKFCEEMGQNPDKPFSGKLPFRTTPEIHRAIYFAATRAGKSINAWMESTLKEAVDRALN
ncbi:MAG: type II toxin-antitoxin system HicB family antitoxin [Cyanobacteria bacterium J06638_20]